MKGGWSCKAGSRLIQSNYIGKNIGRDETGSHKTGSCLIQGVAKAVSTVFLICFNFPSVLMSIKFDEYVV